MWHLYGNCYDLTDFLSAHPGGTDALEAARGLPDATALFESYHQVLPRSTLDKYYREKSASTIKTEHGYTYSSDGFLHKVKAKVRDDMAAAGHGSNFWKGGLAEYSFSAFHFGILICMRYLLVCTDVLGSNLPMLVAAAITTGVFRGMMITRDAHSSSHFAYSSSPMVNRIMYRLTMMTMGGSVEHWNNQHIQRHHIETSIIPIDYDTMYPVKRVLSSYKPLWFHRYQHIYMWFLYPITMMAWTLGDVAYVFHPRVTATEKVKSLGVSLAFMFHAWFLPFYALGGSAAAMVVLVEIWVSSIFFSFQFVVNHEVEGTHGHSTFQDWGSYQTLSSHDYAADSWLWCNISGGLNNQIAHHLFPSVHFKYYPRITQIIRRLCKEENISFQHSDSMVGALQKHYEHLFAMGNALNDVKRE